MKMTAALRRAVQAASERDMGVVGYAIHALMTRPKVPYNVGKKRLVLDPEQALSIAFADRLREYTQQFYESGGQAGLRATWHHNANERKAGWLTMILLQAMGMITGAPDYTFAWVGGSGHIELKVDAQLSPHQVHYQRWSKICDVPYAVHRTVDDAIESLIQWGAIIGIPGRGAQDVTTKET